ncbi:MAG: polysaccharide biosynthesis tyrosine autokinase [Bacteroidota bacterium]
MAGQEITTSGTKQEERDFSQIAARMLRAWPFFFITMLAGLVCAYLVNRYSLPTFAVKGSVLVESAAPDPTEMLFGSGMFGQKEKVANQMIVIKSFPVLRHTIDSLPEFAVQYIRVGTLKNLEEYKQSPYKVLIDQKGTDIPFGFAFNVDFIDQDKFKLSFNKKHPYLNLQKTEFRIGEPIVLGDCIIHLQWSGVSGYLLNVFDENYRFTLVDPQELIYDYYENLKVSLETEESSILVVEMDSKVPDKDIDFINTMMNVMVTKNLNEKNQVAINTINFIRTELTGIKDTLTNIEAALERFKSGNMVSDLGSEAQAVYTRMNDLNTQKAQLELKQKYFGYLRKALANPADSSRLIAPGAFGVEDNYLNQMTIDLMSLQLERSTLLREQQGRNQLIIRLIQQVEDKINTLRRTLRQNVDNIERNNQIAISEIDRQFDTAMRQAKKLPSSERKLVNIKRVYDLSESLYLLLMEKKAEAEITRSSNQPDIELVEFARLASPKPKSPKKLINFAIGLLGGFAFTFLLVLGSELLNDKVKSREDLLILDKSPFLGYIPNFHGEQEALIGELANNPRSALAEAIRGIRVNMNFVLQGKELKTLLVTSSIPGEGKSFCSLAVATVLAMSNKRVVVIDADMRRSKMHKMLNLSNQTGLSHYLIGKKELEEVIQRTPIPNLDLIAAGPLSPNPADLLTQDRISVLISDLHKKYDYVVFDTPPIGLVADAYSLMEQTDINLIVVRQDYTGLVLIRELKEKQDKLQDIKFSTIINDAHGNSAYGYGGYGYSSSYTYGSGYFAETKIPIWTKVKNLFRFR